MKKLLVIIAISLIPSFCFSSGIISTVTQRFVIHGSIPGLFMVDTFTGKTWLWNKSHWVPISFECSTDKFDTDPDCENPNTVHLDSSN